MMKKTMIGLALIAGLAAVGVEASSPSTAEKAVATFEAYQEEHIDAELEAQLERLIEAGFRQVGESDVAVLAGGCGFAGCFYKYLVTTPFETRGANPQLRTVSAVVSASSFQPEGKVEKVLSKEELDILFAFNILPWQK